MKHEEEIGKVIAAVEDLVSDSWTGPPKAFFEIPVGEKFGGLVRGVYRSYIVQAPTPRDALRGLQSCIEEQIAAATSRSMTTALVWRIAEKIELSPPENQDLGWRARTRLTVLPEENMS